MKCRQALDVAAGMWNRGAGWPPILGTCANGTTVRVGRAERREGDTCSVPSLVTIIAPEGESPMHYRADGGVMQIGPSVRGPVSADSATTPRERVRLHEQ